MINLRKYGNPPYRIGVLHGGPGAPGSMAPVARELSKDFSVLEPLQTANSVAGQIRELRDVLDANAELPVILIGHSWGAMLGYIFAAKYPEFVRKLIMVCSGVYESKYAEGIMETRLSRLEPNERAEVRKLMALLDNNATSNKDEIMSQIGGLISKADAYDALPRENEILECQKDLHAKVWRDAERLRSSGALLEMGKLIECPVVAIHGNYDPHPAEGVKEPLSRVLSDFRFILLEKCGHEPWVEKEAKDKFFETIRKELQFT